MIQVTKYGAYWPSYPGLLGTGTTTFSTTFATLDAASEGAGLVYRSSVAKSIRKVVFRTGNVTTGGATDLDIRIETVGGDGMPTGTLWAANTNIAHDLVDADDTAWITSAALTADAVIAVGDEVAVVIRNPAASFGNWILIALNKELTNHPYGVIDTTGAAWAKATLHPLITVEYSDGSYEPIQGVVQFGFPASTAFNSGSATNERGNLLQFPFPTRVSGVGVAAGCAAAADFAVKLYDTDGTTQLATTGTIDAEYGAAALKFYPFLTPAYLLANTTYRVVVVPATANTVTLWAHSVATAAMMDMNPMGQKCYESIKTSGSWVETTTSRTWIYLLVDGYDDGAPRARFQIGL